MLLTNVKAPGPLVVIIIIIITKNKQKNAGFQVGIYPEHFQLNQF